ncbi:MAG TPA: hypothetical protein VEU08_01850 [Vicinamibacterales bacterium]|nr:hypothetical protein [Vicinamibacterales bacterium]
MTRRIGSRMLAAAAALACGTAITFAQSAPPGSKDGKGAQIDDAKLQKRTRAVSCVNDSVTLDGVLLDASGGVPVQAVGCTVTIKNSHLKGMGGIQISGMSTVNIENSLIEGTTALQLTDGADVSIKSSTIRGRIQRVGNVKLHDLGDNKWK